MRGLLAAALGLPLAAAAWDYPDSPRGTVVDDLHGHRVADPYRWLEDTDSAETAAWVAAQNRLSRQVLGGMRGREALRAQLTRLWNYEKVGRPQRRGGRYFYRYNSGLQDQDVLMVRDALEAPPRLLLDPNTLSADGTVALTAWEPSPDGRLLAFGLAEAGSDWNRFRVLDVDSGELLDDELGQIKFSGLDWSADGKGIFYARYPQADDAAVFSELRDQELWYHRIGTAQSDDVRVAADPDQPRWHYYGQVSDDGRWLVVEISRDTGEENRVDLIELGGGGPAADARRIRLVTDFDAAYKYIGNLGDVFYFRSSAKAPRGRVVAIDVRRPGAWREVVPQGADTLEAARLVGGRLVLVVMQDATSRVRIHRPNGRLVREIALPGLGSVSTLSGRADDDELFYSFESFLQPETVYRIELDRDQTTVFARPKIDADVAPFVTEQVFYRSADGTRVPMFITRRKDLEPDGAAPVFLYGYGGFNISLTPWYSTRFVTWVLNGGVLAVPNLRGGGEYGHDWHQAGTKERKQNVFDDFIAAAEHLVEAGWTQPARIAIGGGSNGGLLVGAVLNQRPELFGAAWAAVGVMDMLRFHKFTIGWAWVRDYGSSDDPAGFRYLRAYSPYHNLREGTAYPPVLVTTADHDDRVVPGHSFKYAAALQHAQAGDAPTIIRIETRAGHGRGMPTAKQIELTADVLAFLGHHTGLMEQQTRWRRLRGR